MGTNQTLSLIGLGVVYGQQVGMLIGMLYFFRDWLGMKITH